MAKQSIDKLCGNSSRDRLPLNKRYSAKQVGQYVDDLERVLELEGQGKARPTILALQEHFLQELQMDMQQATIARHIRKLEQGNSLWAK